jgi:putative hemolysin
LAGFEFLILLLLILLNGMLAMSELAVVSARTSRLQQRAADHVRGAHAALDLAENPNRFLSTVQIGITLIGIVTGAFGGATLSGPLANLLGGIPGLGSYSDQVGVFVVVVFITYLSLLIGELVPKRLALQQAEAIACLVAPAMTKLSRIASPVVALLAISSDVVIRLLGIKASNEPAVTEEEVDLLLQQGAEAGIFHESERRMVAGVFDIGDRSANELMTPRHAIDFLDLLQPDEVNRKVMAEHPHNFYPVCEGSTDNVVGVVATRELWRRHLNGEPTDLRSAMEPALFVPEISPILPIIDQMRHQRSSMAIVVDEYGGVEGLLTLNDVLSDVVGEIDDPQRTNIKGGVRRDDGSWLLDGVFPAHELRELFDIEHLPGEDEGRFETLAGFVMDQLGVIPSVGDAFTWSAFRFEVVDMDGIRIDKVLVSRIDPGDDDRETGTPVEHRARQGPSGKSRSLDV